jgi:hypothetical protein
MVFVREADGEKSLDQLGTGRPSITASFIGGKQPSENFIGSIRGSDQCTLRVVPHLNTQSATAYLDFELLIHRATPPACAHRNALFLSRSTVCFSQFQISEISRCFAKGVKERLDKLMRDKAA